MGFLAGAADFLSTYRNWGTFRKRTCCEPSIWGLGMLLVIPAAKFKKAQGLLERIGEKHYTVGRIVKGERKVMYV